MYWFLMIIAMTNGQPSVSSLTPMPDKATCEDFVAKHQDMTVAKPDGTHQRFHTNFRCTSAGISQK